MPYILLKAPISIGEELVLCDDSVRITEKAAFDYINAVRKKAAAVMTDVETILKYNPPMEYSCSSYNPLAVFVIDPDFKIPLSAEVLQNSEKRKAYIITSKESLNNKKNKWCALTETGTGFITADKSVCGVIDYVSIIKRIAHMGVGSIFIEGAGPFSYSMLRSGIVNSIIFYSSYNINMHEGINKRKIYENKSIILEKIHAKDISFMKMGRNILIKCKLQQ